MDGWLQARMDIETGDVQARKQLAAQEEYGWGVLIEKLDPVLLKSRTVQVVHAIAICSTLCDRCCPCGVSVRCVHVAGLCSLCLCPSTEIEAAVGSGVQDQSTKREQQTRPHLTDIRYMRCMRVCVSCTTTM